MTWLVSAFLLGLFGSIHCVVMCGGIAGALSGGLVQVRRGPTPTRNALGYNIGRIASYAFLGALVGGLGRSLDFIPFLGVARVGLRLGAGVLLVGSGLYIAGAWSRFAAIERVGAPVWRRVQPVAAKLLRSRSLLAPLAVGALWGLMPCGLVYAAFGVALASGSIAAGALTMIAFGLGTAPAMLATGLASARTWRGGAWLRRAAGVLILACGVVDVTTAAASLAEPEHSACCAGHHARAL